MNWCAGRVRVRVADKPRSFGGQTGAIIEVYS